MNSFRLIAAAGACGLTTSLIIVTTALAQPSSHRHPSHHNPHVKSAPFVIRSVGTARAIAPRDWLMTASAQGNAVDLSSPDKSMYAGWGMTSINRSMERYYGSLYGDPETSELTLVGMVAKSQGDSSTARYTSKPEKFGDGYFTRRTFATAKKEGELFYHIYPTNGDNYIQSVFFAMGDRAIWERKSGIVTSIALSIRSRVTLNPPIGTEPGPSAQKEAPEQDRAFRDYNEELGTQWCHSKDGDVYNVDVDDDYWKDGPDGSGYYRAAGNGWEKLEPGTE